MPKKNKQSSQKHFYGTATVGEKGQIVIPKGARKDMKLKKGDHLLVFGMHDQMIAITKLSHIEEIAAHFSSMVSKGQSSRQKREKP